MLEANHVKEPLVWILGEVVLLADVHLKINMIPLILKQLPNFKA